MQIMGQGKIKDFIRTYMLKYLIYIDKFFCIYTVSISFLKNFPIGKSIKRLRELLMAKVG